MGNFLSSLFGNKNAKTSSENPDNSNTHIKDNEIALCDEIEEKLSDILINAAETSDIIEMKKLYDEAISYVECNSTEVIKLKDDIFQVYQELIYIKSKEIYDNFKEEQINESDDIKRKYDIYQINIANINKIITELEQYSIQYSIDDKVSKLLNELISKKNYYETEASKMDGSIKILQIKRLAAFIYCGYNLSLISSYNKDTNKSTDDLLDSINKILDLNLTFDSYYYLLQFSELLYLLYPIEDTEDGDKSVVDKNTLKIYLNLEDKSKSKLYKHLQFLGLYYAKFYYNNQDLNKKENDEIMSKEYSDKKSEVDKYLKLNSTQETLYKETKTLFKTQPIEHWKGLIQMSRKRLPFNTSINYIPKTLPIYYFELEQYLSSIYITNLIYFNLGSISDNGQYTYYNINPLKYEEIFSDEAWDRTTKINKTEIKDSLKEPINRYESGIKFIKDHPNLSQKDYDDSKFTLKLTSDKYGTLTDKTIVNHTAYITDKFLQKFINEGVIKIPPLGAYKFVKNDYVINYTLIPNILNNIRGNKAIDYFGNCSNNFLINSIDYMCEIYDKRNGNFSEFVSQLYYEIVTGSLTWNMIFPLQSLNINMTINNNDFNYLTENFPNFKTNDEKYDHMIDRSTLFKKNNGGF